MTPAPGVSVLSTLRNHLRSRWKYILKQAERVQTSNGPKAVHELRVTTRRLEELDALACDVIRTPARKRTPRTLRASRKAAGGVRNADVMLALVQEQRNRGDSDHLLWAPIAERLRGRREKQRAKMRRRLSALDLPRLEERWLDALRAWPRRDAEAEARVLADLKAHVTKRREQFEDARAHAARPDAPTADIHALRIAGKRLRYALEVAADLGDEDAKIDLEHLRESQETLGQWHDLEMLCELIIGHCSRPRALRDQLPAARQLLQRLGHMRFMQTSRLTRSLKILADHFGTVEPLAPEEHAETA